MAIGLMTVVNGYVPPARWPSTRKVARLGAWGGVAVAGLLFMVQPWDWLAVQVGLKKAEEK
eukprot:CAMPEP_0175045736 /NCGR_PEP_ID=MMETSP0052_2-20121109/4610_2 /TAXON_ID=51329 ORGANISM="Polytomella parva, Strain SAG 63-3" /NCGR_SAMPLE_ID=MMETSP0052_2 /ASSEMBLY_ACC=CAM_ASM_000194 /LENGTH=60 /DNA_ID=CAMNT_0016309343 /DNA_START=93 /DNA_END=275 /DNA_ORIENTATION=-